ncbi:hypothetical protein [Nitrospira sp. Nam74]
MPAFLMPLILQVLAALPGLIQTAERAFTKPDGESTGPAKKEFVLNAVGTAVDVAKSTGEVHVTDAQREAILSAAGSLTDATVATFKAVGLFSTPARITASADDKSFTPGPGAEAPAA